MSPLLHVCELNSPVLRSLVEWNLSADCQHVYSGKMTKLLWWHYMWTWMCTRYGALLSICCLICWISTACTTLQPIAHFTLFECVNDPVMPPGTGMPSHTLRASNRLFFGGFSFFFFSLFLRATVACLFSRLVLVYRLWQQPYCFSHTHIFSKVFQCFVLLHSHVFVSHWNTSVVTHLHFMVGSEVWRHGR